MAGLPEQRCGGAERVGEFLDPDSSVGAVLSGTKRREEAAEVVIPGED